MSARRAARSSSAGLDNGLPSNLAKGPCIEDWADDPPGIRPDYMSARRNWTRTLTKWAESVGRDPNKARDLARTPDPWSRDYLHATGRADWADYYDGKRSRPAGEPGLTWQRPPWWHHSDAKDAAQS